MDGTMADTVAQPKLPIYVDLDGTLVKTDVAQELLCQAAAHPKNWVTLLKSTLRGKAELKTTISEITEFDAATLPYREEVLTYLKQEKARGRQIILASATDMKIAQKVSDYIDIFSNIIASESGKNLKGQAKLSEIQKTDSEFEYIGDSKADLPIWRDAQAVGFVNAPAAAAPLKKQMPVSLEINDRSSTPASLLKAMRPHQWAKNALILLPLFFSHQYGDVTKIAQALLAVIIFSFCASAIYIVNDILDIEADRKHSKKKFRPFAAGELSPITGITAAMGLLGIALTSSALFFGAIVTSLFIFYIISTTLYSTWLKHKPIMDVVVLTCLYTLRIFVGGVAISTALSPWLLNFSLFFFASLAFMKRYTEMLRVQAKGKDAARGYLVSDLAAILPMGITTGGLAVLTLTLYLNSAYVAQTYGAVQILWLIAPLMMFWIFRAWLKALRDQIDDDPVVFALKDPISRITLGITIGVVLAAKFLVIEGVFL